MASARSSDRRAASKLAAAKNSSYGWSDENVAAQNLAQLGTAVPFIAFEEVYQEVLAVWCREPLGPLRGRISTSCCSSLP